MDDTQNMVARVQEKTKYLFETDIDIEKEKKYKPKIMENMNEEEIYKQTIHNFDDQLNATWKKTQLQLKKIKNMNQHFQRSNQAKYNIADKYEHRDNVMNESIASSHWTLDSQNGQSMPITSLKILHEESTQNGELLVDDTFNEDKESKNIINLAFKRLQYVTIDFSKLYTESRSPEVTVTHNHQSTISQPHHSSFSHQFISIYMHTLQYIQFQFHNEYHLNNTFPATPY